MLIGEEEFEHGCVEEDCDKGMRDKGKKRREF